MIRVLLNREGWSVGKDQVYRLYTEEGLGRRKRPTERRRAVVHRQERFKPTGPNQVWAGRRYLSGLLRMLLAQLQGELRQLQSQAGESSGGPSH